MNPTALKMALPIYLSSILLCNLPAVEFAKDILPILEARCFDCHGPDKQKAGLRLDRRASMIRGGDTGQPTIVPGNSSKSFLIEVLVGSDPDLSMPPKGAPLNDAQISLFKKWIDKGAVWPGQMDEVAKEEVKHWSFLPVIRPDVPPGASNPVDAFLNRRLNEAGVKPNGSADARSLIRRASVVLTGLQPKPERVSTFIRKFQVDSESAYLELVEELLASPHFGERWAQHWLDVIRWAESNGSEANLYRKNAWVYRDYVARAFNRDLPYDQFVREQIAGDSLGAGDATGFLVAGPHVPAATVGREPSAIRQARADRMDEIMQTVGASVMGVTMSCARCHNHKFDPISIQDYYSMTGVFQDIEFGGRFPELAKDHPRRQRSDAIWSEIAKHRKKLRHFGHWEENWGSFRELHFPPFTTRAVRILFKSNYVSLDELEVMGPTGSVENYALNSKGAKVSGFPEKGSEGRNPIGRVNDGNYGTMAWRGKGDGKKKPFVQYDFNEDKVVARLRLSSNREYFNDTDYLVQKPNLPRYEFDLHYLKDDGTWQPWTGTWYANKKMAEMHPGRKEILENIQKQIDRLADEGPKPSFVGRFVPPVVTRVLHRGSPESPRDEVMPGGPKVLGGELNLTGKSSGAKRRLEFAKWISSRDNPLTSRVMVNRVWHHVFGSGIVPTTSDFGRAGAQPTHPELLDWLASEFALPIRSNASSWSVKDLLRLILHSDAFKRSSLPNTASLKSDANSALLWRFPPRRVSAEVIRDGILQASGKLDTTVGGRSYRIHNVKKTYAQWEVIDNHGPHTWRRMLYQERMRRVDDKMFTAFDFPDCGQVRAKRPVSTTPLQALNLMNSNFVVEQSSFIAERAKSETEGKGMNAAVRRAFALLLSRQPDSGEMTAAKKIAQERGLKVVCRSLINSNEFAFLP